jgi:bifunctional non-homologous end joining protein LigD
METQSISLTFQEGSSDKVYNAELNNLPDGWVVNFAYGRRGNALTTGTKTKDPVTYEVAKKAYDKLVKSKTAKGYKPLGVSGSPINIVTTTEDSGIRPQLLNEITEKEALMFIHDDSYCMQEKFDGCRKMIIRDEDGTIKGANKKGTVTSLAKEINDAFTAVKAPYILDGEDMGGKIMLFDDITEPHLPYIERYQILRELTHYTTSKIEVVKTAWNMESKIIMWNRVKRERGEGVVFKRTNTAYYAGRPASGGDQFKCKFYESASCIVTSISSVKSSIGVSVVDDHDTISVGNVTLYANSPSIKIGDIVEVKYLYYNEGGSLYQPVLLAKRDDVDMDECLLSKLKRKKDGVK